MLLPGIELSPQPRWQLGRWLWERCAAKGVLLAFLALAAVPIALSYVLPQVPAYIHANSISYREWLSTVQVRFRDWTPFLDAAGAFYILETSWFRALLGLLAFILLVSAGNEAGALPGHLLHSQLDEPYERTMAIAMVSTLPTQQVVDSVRQTMNALFHQVLEQGREDRVYLLGRHSSWLSVGPLVLRLGLLLVVSALAINGRWGWQQPAVQILPGEPVLVGPRGLHQIELLDVPTSAAEARLKIGTGQQLLLRQGDVFYQRGYRYLWAGESGPVVEITATDGNGRALTLSDYAVRPLPAESLRFTFSLPSSLSQEEADRLFIVPEERMVARLKWLRPGQSEAQAPAQFHLWVFQGDGQTLIGDCPLTATSETAVAVVGGVRFALRFSHSIVLYVAYQPGTWVLGVGAVLAVLGLVIGLIPRRYMRSVIDPGHDRVSICIEEHVAGLSWGYQRRRDRLLARLRGQLGET